MGRSAPECPTVLRIFTPPIKDLLVINISYRDKSSTVLLLNAYKAPCSLSAWKINALLGTLMILDLSAQVRDLHLMVLYSIYF